MISELIISFILGAAGALGVSRFGPSFGLLDAPSDRSSHAVPTTKGGGIGILFSFLFISITTGRSPLFWIPILLLALLSMYGDRKELSASIRLICQITATTIVVTGWYFQGSVSFLILLPFWILFLTGTANFYNFMDGINGLAGLTGVIAFGLAALFLSLQDHDHSLVFLSGAIAAACAGFLPFNMPKAQVFMGDIGSILLGLVFGIVVMLASHTPLDFLCFASLLFPFYIDELTTMAIRIHKRERLSVAHRTHLYQLLVNERGFAHWQISCCYGLLQLLIGAASFSLRPYGIGAVLTFLFISSFIFIAFSARIRFQMQEK